MGEIVTIQVGKCGNMVGTEFWETICTEHGINRIGASTGDSEYFLRNIKTYFREMKGLTYAPRSILIDLDKSTMEEVRVTAFGKIFKPDNFIFGTEGAGNNWAKGHFTEGAKLCGSALDVIRRESEACDCLLEFETIHSIGGGTGGGLGSLLICKLRDEYPKKLISTYSVIPSPKVSNHVVEPYNAILSFHHLIDNTHKTFCMDNEALFHIISEVLKLNKGSICKANSLIASAMSGITACVRFPGTPRLGFKKFAVNAVPLPTLHFFVPGLAPMLSREGRIPRRYSAADIASSAFNYNNFLAACDIRQGSFLTSTCIFRGKLSTKIVENQMQNLIMKNSSRFVEWIPNNQCIAFCDIPPAGYTESVTVVANTTAIQDVLKRIAEQYKKMFNKKAFLHWYTDEGMDLMEFEAADAALSALADDYSSAGNTTVSPQACD